MEIFHVLGVGCNIKALRFMERRPRVLVSAWSYHDPQNNFKKHKAIIREKSESIVVDSGFLSAAKNGRSDWADRLDLVLECAEDLQADRVSMMDIPMEPHILRSAGFVRADGAPDFGRALELTYRNAEQMLKATTKAAKGFVNQGWTLEHRQECHRVMTAMGAGEAADWWGIGTVCMRTPETGLYEHAKWCRDNIKGHIHCFGIAKAPWVREMMHMGINSCDSATAASASRFTKLIANGTQRDIIGRGGERLRQNNLMAALLYWYNLEAIEHEVFRPDADPPVWKPNEVRQEMFGF